MILKAKFLKNKIITSPAVDCFVTNKDRTPCSENTKLQEKVLGFLHKFIVKYVLIFI